MLIPREEESNQTCGHRHKESNANTDDRSENQDYIDVIKSAGTTAACSVQNETNDHQRFDGEKAAKSFEEQIRDSYEYCRDADDHLHESG